MPTKPKIWTMGDVPRPSEAAVFLARVQAARDAFRKAEGFPELPPDMDRLTFEEANDIERALLRVQETIGRLEKSRVYSGEFLTGGV